MKLDCFSAHRVYSVGAVALILAVGPLLASQLLTRERALTAAYPGAAIQAETIFLTDAQRREAASLSGVEIPTPMIARYIATSGGVPVGRGYVDTHVVRTKRESLLILLDADGSLKRIEVTAFLEPPEYLAGETWYRQYEGKSLDGDLNLDRAIRTLAGATLTARATNQAVRRVLAIDKVLMRGGGVR
jgi:hypothetical protein